MQLAAPGLWLAICGKLDINFGACYCGISINVNIDSKFSCKSCQEAEHIVFQYVLRKKRNDVEGKKTNERFSNLGTAMLVVVS
jgi:hypothetical protein